jgi:hypothetical protein
MFLAVVAFAPACEGDDEGVPRAIELDPDVVAEIEVDGGVLSFLEIPHGYDTVIHMKYVGTGPNVLKLLRSQGATVLDVFLELSPDEAPARLYEAHVDELAARGVDYREPGTLEFQYPVGLEGPYNSSTCDSFSNFDAAINGQVESSTGNHSEALALEDEDEGEFFILMAMCNRDSGPDVSDYKDAKFTFPGVICLPSCSPTSYTVTEEDVVDGWRVDWDYGLGQIEGSHRTYTVQAVNGYPGTPNSYIGIDLELP